MCLFARIVGVCAWMYWRWICARVLASILSLSLPSGEISIPQCTGSWAKGESGGSSSRIHNRSLNRGKIVHSPSLFLPILPSVLAIVVPSIQYEWILQHKRILILNTQTYHRVKVINIDHRGNRDSCFVTADSSKQKHLKLLVSKTDNSNTFPQNISTLLCGDYSEYRPMFHGISLSNPQSVPVSSLTGWRQ